MKLWPIFVSWLDHAFYKRVPPYSDSRIRHRIWRGYNRGIHVKFLQMLNDIVFCICVNFQNETTTITYRKLHFSEVVLQKHPVPAFYTFNSSTLCLACNIIINYYSNDLKFCLHIHKIYVYYQIKFHDNTTIDVHANVKQTSRVRIR